MEDFDYLNQDIHLGLIGKRLDYSYSKIIHETYFDSQYDLIELKSKEDFKEFFASFSYQGVNVTNPYKQEVIPYLTAIDDIAKETNSVNTIVNHDGMLIGYNTDYFGFIYLLSYYKIDLKNKNVYILGSGGVSKTIYVALRNKAKNVTIVSREKKENGFSKVMSYEELETKEDIDCLINATPVGVTPSIFDIQPSIKKILKNNSDIIAIDLNYNPKVSYFCALSKHHYNGLPMLVKQAALANNMMSGRITEYDLEKIISDLSRYKNYFVIGMMGSGKTTFGKYLAKEKKMKFVDTDSVIEERNGKTISELIQSIGIVQFRKIEEEIVKEYALKEGYVISCGGGIIYSDEAMVALKSNGLCYFMNEDTTVIFNRLNQPEELAKRPLIDSKNLFDSIEKIVQERLPLYHLYRDFNVKWVGDHYEIEKAN